MNSAKIKKARLVEFDGVPSDLVEHGSIAITNGFDPQQVIQMAFEKGALHVVQKNCRTYEQELLVSEVMLFRPQFFLQDPVSVILDKKPIHEFRVECSAQDHKKIPLEKLELFISSLHGSRSIMSEVVSSTEEIYTNASKNTGNFYKHLKSVTPPQVAREGSISLVAGATQDTLVVGCIDSFGLLDVQSLLARILTCYDRGIADSIRMGAGGAGIGTFLVYSFAMNIYIAVEKNKKTAVFCSYPLGMRTKDFEQLPKNLHLMSI